VRHGWEGVVLKLFRAKDFTFTVTGAEQVTERYRRVHFTDEPGDTIEATVQGTGLQELVTPDTYVWIACDTVTTRALTSYVVKDLAVPKQRVKSLGYWKAA
jgi:NADPH-dependent ferric siderophore reductase